MEKPQSVARQVSPAIDGSIRWPWWIGLACVLVLVIAMLLPHPNPPAPTRAGSGLAATAHETPATSGQHPKHRHPTSPGVPALTPEEVVAAKVVQFAKSRRGIFHAMAKQSNADVSPEVEQFFDAAEAGRWEELKRRFESLRERRRSEDPPADLKSAWGAIQETLGVAEVAHDWPAQKLLDYGNSILDSLRPGMVYVGGTDPGRFIPTLLNETSEGEHHVVLTQNALADRTYLDYVSFLYGDRMAALGETESQRAFQDYIAGAQRRLLHDQQNPGEPSQLLPGEDVRMNDNRVQVSGQVAVMAINERLLQMFMESNPGFTFALEESFPLRSTYSNAVPLGPIMELGVSDPQTTFTVERVDQSLNFWRDVAQQLATDPETPFGSDPRKAYAKMASAQASLFNEHHYTAQAEQAFSLATQICPTSPEAVFGYVNLLVAQNRFADALPVIQAAVNGAPDYQQFSSLLATVRARLSGDGTGG